MVTAEEYVWDSFTKAYPDAQSYKFRTVPSYQKLCVIYGEEVPNGRPSCTAHNQDLKSKDPDSDYSKTDWTPPMDRYLIDLLLNQVHIGHKVNHIFSKEAWIDILASFNDRFGSDHDKNVLNNQYKRLKKLYNDIKHLLKLGRVFQASRNRNCLRSGWTPPMDRYFIDLMLEQIRRGNMVDQNFNEQAWSDMFDKCVLENQYLSLMDQYNNVNTFFYQNGFTWNEMQQKLTADDLVWEAYIEHLDAKVYKDIILENYGDLSVIFGDESHDDKSSYVCPEMGFDYNALEMGMDGVFGALRSLARDIEVSNVRKIPRSTIATHGRKLQKTSDELQEVGRSNTAEKNCISIERIVDALPRSR
ncbi:uncharacterized protein LOC130782265 [Actinidia eriantha]|uniref:uncharacterized protein LOC130782265 n=1 Tax=Actinidia eriantha TaxID=165200 RepID=UPI00258DFA2A|nr:uncharacterized protein LOC130782265 [Actinidia eriantha]